MRKGGWTYFMTNGPRGVRYIGVTTDLAARVQQHRQDKGSAFYRRYNLNILVYTEEHETIDEMIAREKAWEAWERYWEIRLIEQGNPDWRDLFAEREPFTS